jgi:hypothetical protein
MQYIIYQITNQLNGKIYIGAHATKNINDDHLREFIEICKGIVV